MLHGAAIGIAVDMDHRLVDDPLLAEEVEHMAADTQVCPGRRVGTRVCGIGGVLETVEAVLEGGDLAATILVRFELGTRQSADGALAEEAHYEHPPFADLSSNIAKVIDGDLIAGLNGVDGVFPQVVSIMGAFPEDNGTYANAFCPYRHPRSGRRWVHTSD